MLLPQANPISVSISTISASPPPSLHPTRLRICTSETVCETPAISPAFPNDPILKVGFCSREQGGGDFKSWVCFCHVCGVI
ncbi:hypothetical protein ACFX15_002008 [Malus domestica]